ncbi:MAG: tRNA-dihydrouridine synthase [Alphaproteobacteria bacterium]|nr:tRNA-dihydrouridine synthase [Alphaproteobacteria bacterium]
MIGRGSNGRPWFLKQAMDYLREGIATSAPPFRRQYETMLEHFDSMLTHYGTNAGLRISRKHIGWYSKGLPRSSEFRVKVNTSGDAETVRTLMKEFYAPMVETSDG